MAKTPYTFWHSIQSMKMNQKPMNCNRLVILECKSSESSKIYKVSKEMSIVCYILIENSK